MQTTDDTPYSVQEVDALTGFSRDTITWLFENEPGVLIIDRPSKLHKRKYRSIRIPRVVRELSVKTGSPYFSGIAQRSELLSAKEREVLENHLQAEIAAEIQRLMRAADRQVVAINDELHKRPTSTGVRYRLQPPLSLEDGAPVGFEVAREPLLNTSSDLWSADDWRAVGTVL
jgi:hypothetical protein